MKMAAGVSINMKTVIPFLGLCVILAGTKSVKDDHSPAYSVVVSDPSIHVVAITPSEHLLRARRQASPSPSSSNNDSSTPTPTTMTALGPEATRTMSPSAPAQPPRGPTPTTTTVSTTTVEMTTPGNVSLEYDEHHTYYTSKVEAGQQARWLMQDDMGKIITHESLSHSHRTAATIPLTFTFPFYGHPVQKITIATGGFLYMSEFLHQWLTATQYIAPLMANFDSQLGNDSNIHYADNGTMFAVWWENLHLQDQEDVGPFTFQALLNIDGTIIFNYQQIPINVARIKDKHHVTTIGLADAYYWDENVPFFNVRRRTIYEYHRVEISRDDVVNQSTVVMKPLPTCGLFKECVSCIESQIDFNCQWCSKLARCSDGLDRHRQKWLEADCTNKELKSAGECPTPAPPRIVTDSSGNAVTDENGVVQTYAPEYNRHVSDDNKKGSPGLGVGGVVGILLVLFLIIVITSGFIYAYTHPQSRAGIWLIEKCLSKSPSYHAMHRPTNLRAKLSQVKFWKRGESGAEKYEVSMGPDGESVA